MRVLTREEFELNPKEFFSQIKEGSLFIHPTDTIYGLSCDATHPPAVQKLRQIKERFDHPFSVIAPSLEWIKENCVITTETEKWLKKLPGPYTLILKLRNLDCVAPEVLNGYTTLGIRIPNHWFSKQVKKYGQPVITTSANRLGKDFMTDLENLDVKIKPKLDFIIFEGSLNGRPSTIVHLEKENIKVRKR